MCSNNKNGGKREHSYGTPRKVAVNLFKPMPVEKKIQQFSVNMWRRIALRQLCCGHPGEAGC